MNIKGVILKKTEIIKSSACYARVTKVMVAFVKKNYTQFVNIKWNWY